MGPLRRRSGLPCALTSNWKRRFPRCGSSLPPTMRSGSSLPPPSFTVHVGGDAAGEFAGRPFHWRISGEIGRKLAHASWRNASATCHARTWRAAPMSPCNQIAHRPAGGLLPTGPCRPFLAATSPQPGVQSPVTCTPFAQRQAARLGSRPELSARIRVNIGAN